jgi:hypothetical protein
MTDPAAQPKAYLIWDAVFLIAVWIVAVACFVWGFWSLGQSVYDWLRFGVWSQASIGDGLWALGMGKPSTSWIGVNGVLQWILHLPLWIGLFPIGSLLVKGCSEAGEELDRQRSMLRRSQQ